MINFDVLESCVDVHKRMAQQRFDRPLTKGPIHNENPHENCYHFDMESIH